MQRKTTSLTIALLIGLASVVVLYMSRGTSQTAIPPAFAVRQTEIADLKKQIAGLQERVNWLEERLAEPQRHKEAQF